MIKAGVQIDHWQSDLYVPMNETTREIVSRYRFKCNVETFISQIEKQRWYCIPFAYPHERIYKSTTPVDKTRKGAA
jgi:hypothetical protein